MSETIYPPKLEQPEFTRHSFEVPKQPTVMFGRTYRYILEQDGERLLGTCLDLENVFVDGTNEEDVVRKLQIVIDEYLNSRDIQDKDFNLRQTINFYD